MAKGNGFGRRWYGLFVLVGLALFAPAAVAQTTVPAGTIAVDTTWDVAGSPYTVQGIVQVEGQDGADSVTALTIEEGVTVLFDPGAALDIGLNDAGALIIVDGGGSAPIFTSSNTGLEAPGDWFGITFHANTDAAVTQVDFMDLRYGAGDRTVGGDGMVVVDGSSPTLNNISIQDALEHGLWLDNGSAPTISGLTITGTGLTGVTYAAGGGTLSNVNITGAGTNGITAGNNSSGSVTTGTIVNPAAYGIEFVGNTTVTFDGLTQIDRAFNFVSGSAASSGAITNSTINGWDTVSPGLTMNALGRVLATNTINGMASGTLSPFEGNAVNFDGTWPSTVGGNALVVQLPGAIHYIAGQDGGDSLTTLTVEAGVQVEFALAGGLNVGNGASFPGALVVQGTNGNPVVFTSSVGSPAAGDWNGVYFSADADGTPGSVDYLTVQYAGRSNFGEDAGVYLSGSGLVLNDVRVENSLEHGFTLDNNTDAILLRPVAPSAGSDGIHILSATGTITDANLTGPTRHGVYVRGGTPGLVNGGSSGAGDNGLRIENAAAPAVNGFGVSGSTNAAVFSSSSGTFTLDNMTITTPGTVGMELESFSATIQNTSITGGTNGIMATTSSPTLDTVSIISPTGYGLNFIGATSATIQNCPQLDNSFFFDNASGDNTITGNTINDMSSFVPQVGAGDVHALVNGGNTFNNMVAGNDLNILGETITTDSVWPRNLGGIDVTYRVVSGIVVVQGVDGGDFVTSLTLNPGLTMAFDGSTGLDVGPSAGAGALIADGDAINPITFTSAAGSPAGGDWYGVFMGNGLREDVTVMDFVTIEYGGEARFGSWNANLRLELNDQVISNSTFRESGHTGVTIINGGPTLNGCNISGSANVGMFLNEANATLFQCSITNNTLHGLWFGPGNNACVIDDCTVDGGIYEASGSTTNSYSDSTLTGFGKNTSRLAAGSVSGILTEGGNTVENCEGLVTAEILGGTLTKDAVWPGLLCGDPATYNIIDDGASTDITVQGFDGPDLVTTWTIEAGATLAFAPGTLAINVGQTGNPGAIVMNGSLANPITVTSSSGTPARGDWHGLYLGSGNNPAISVFNYVDFAYGGNNRWNSNRDANVLMLDTSATMNNCTFRESGNHGISLEDSTLVLNNGEIYNNDGDGIYSWQSTVTVDGTPIHDVGRYGANLLRSISTLSNGSDISNSVDYGIYFDNNSSGNSLTVDGISVQNGFFGQDYYGFFEADNSTFSNLSAFPLALGAADVGHVLSDPSNTFTGTAPGDVVTLHGETINKDATWASTLGGSAIEYFVANGYLTIEGIDGIDFVTTLTLDPGVVLKFDEVASNQRIHVGLNEPGALNAVGTAGQPIIMTSNAAVPARGDWKGIRYWALNSSALSRLEYVEIHYAGDSLGAIDIDDTSVSLTNVTITESAADGIYSWNGYTGVINATNLVIDGVDAAGFRGDDADLTWDGVQISNTGDEGFFSNFNLKGTINNLTITNPDLNGSGAYGFVSLSTSNITLTNSTFDNSLRFNSSVGANSVSGSTFNDVGAFPPVLPANEIGPTLFANGNTFNDVTLDTVIPIIGERVFTDTTWAATLGGQPISYQVTSADVDVYGNDGPDGTTTLVLDPGVTIAFDSGWDMTFGWFGMGAVVADGNPAQPITFTTSNPVPAPGQWDNLYFGADLDPALSILDNVIVEYTGGVNDNGALTFSEAVGLQVSDTILRNGSQYGIEMTNSNATFTNVTIENMGERGILINGDSNNLLGTTGTFNNVTVTNSGWEGLYGTDSRPVINTMVISGVGSGYYGMYFNNSTYARIDSATVDQGITWVTNAGVNTVTNSTFNDYTNYPSAIHANEVGQILFTGNNTFNGVVAGDRVTAIAEWIQRDATWDDQLNGAAIEYVMTADTYIRGTDGPDGVTTLTLNPGVRMAFNPFAALTVGDVDQGALVANGTLAEPIFFTSSSATPAAGDWEGLRFHEVNNSAVSSLQHVILEYGGQTSIGAGNLYMWETSLNVSNVTSRFSGSYGIRIDSNSTLTATDITIEDSLNHGVFLGGGCSFTMTNATITNAGNHGVYSDGASSNLTNVDIVNPTNWGLLFFNTGSHSLDNVTADHAFSFEQTGGTHSIINSTFNDVDSWRPTMPSNYLGRILWDNSNTFNDVLAGTRVRAMAETITKDATWQPTLSGQPIAIIVAGTDWDNTGGTHYIQGADGADSVTTLTLLPGTNLRFESGTNMYVGFSDTGALNATGTLANPILLTSNQDSPTAGYWGSLRFYDFSNGSLSNMSHVVMEYGGSGSGPGFYLEDMSISMDNLSIGYTGGHGMQGYRAGITLMDSEIHNTGRRGVSIDQGFLNIDPTSIHDTGWEGLYLYNTATFLDQVTVYNVNPSYYGLRFDSTSNAVVQNSSFENNFTILNATGTNTFTGNTFHDFSTHLPTIPADEVGQILYSGGNTFNDVSAGDQVTLLSETITRDATWPGSLSSTAIEFLVNFNVLIQGYDGADSVTTLSMAPGTTIRLGISGNFSVGNGTLPGALRAIGTDLQKVTFTSDNPTPAIDQWNGIYFSNTNSPALSRLENVVIEWGGRSGNEAVQIYRTALAMDKVVIRNFGDIGIYLDDPIGAALSNLEIYDVTEQGIYVYLANAGAVSITDSVIDGTGYHGIYSNSSNFTMDNVAVQNVGPTYYGIEMISTSNINFNNVSAEHGFTFNSASGANVITNSTFTDFSLFTPTLPANEVGQILFTGGNTFLGVVAEDEIQILAEDVSNDAIWPAALGGVPVHLVQNAGDLHVRGTDGPDFVTTLTLNPGVTLKFGTGANFYVGNGAPGALSADGLPAAPITFTSSQLSPAPGDWQEVWLYDQTNQALTIIDNCIFEYGGRNSGEAMLHMYYANVDITSSVFRESNWDGLELEYSSANISNSQFYNINMSGIFANFGADGNVTNSTFTNNSSGIYLVGGTTLTVGGGSGLGNDFLGNNSGVNASTGSLCVDATHNYWGDAAGPNDTDATDDGCMGPVSNLTGGDNVSQDVSYAPFAATFVNRPTPPDLLSPANPSEVNGLAPTLILTDSPTPVDTYTFELASDLAFTQNVQTSPATPPGGGGTTSWVVGTPLMEDTLYFWRAKATNGTGDSAWTPVWRFYVNATNNAPFAPTLLAPGDGDVTADTTPLLNIGNASDRDDSIVTDYPLTYQFEVYDDVGLTSLVASVTGRAEGAGTTNWTVSPALAEDMQYWWRARANDGVNDGDWSSTFTFWLNANNSAPTAPVVSAPADGTDVGLTGPALVVTNSTDSDGDTLTYDFEVYSDFNQVVLVETTTGVTEGAGTTSYTVTATLEESEIYYWRSRSFDGFTWSPWTPLSSFETQGFALGHAAIQGYLAGQDQDRPEEVRYTFPARSGDAIIIFEGYDIDANELDVSVNGGTPQAVSAQVNDGWSGQLQVTLPDAEVNDGSPNTVVFDNLLSPSGLEEYALRNVDLLKPQTPQNVSATAYNTVIDIQWDPVNDGLAIGYNLYRGPSASGPWTKLNGSLLTDTLYRDMSLSNGTTYHYYVESEAADTTVSDPSPTVSGTPSAGVVTAVTDLQVTKTGNDITLTFTVVTNSPGITEYRIYRDGAILVDANVDVGVGQVGTDVDGTWVDVGAGIDGNTYFYEVRPFDGSTQATD